MNVDTVLNKTIEEYGTDDLRTELQNNADDLHAYVGYEPSGVLHIGHLITAQKLKDLQEIGVSITVLMADIHAHINGKGDLDEIREIGKNMSSQLIAFGLDKDSTNIVFGSDFQYSKDYQNDVYKLNQEVTLDRARRSMSEIAGDESEKVSSVLYPLMQSLDIHHLDVDIAVGGMEQRKVHMLARDELPKIGIDKPYFIHTPLISDLNGANNKMSSSSGVTISAEDSSEKVTEKIESAYCPKENIENNPIIELYENLVFRNFKNIKVQRPEKYGGDIIYSTFDRFSTDYKNGDLHPTDVKNSLSIYINRILDPIRKQI